MTKSQLSSSSLSRTGGENEKLVEFGAKNVCFLLDNFLPFHYFDSKMRFLNLSDEADQAVFFQICFNCFLKKVTSNF